MKNDNYQERNLKSFIKVGQSFIDIKRAVGISFYRDPYAYVIVQFVFENGKAMNAILKNRNEFSQFLLQLDHFIDDPVAMNNMEQLMNNIEKLEPIVYNQYTGEYEKYKDPSFLDSSLNNNDNIN